MCGRAETPNIGLIMEQFPVEQTSLDIQQNYNAAPTQSLPVIVETKPEIWEVRLMHWGLLPRWKTDKPIPPPINARAETLTEKAMFKKLVPANRCLVPAMGFYEWQATGAGKSKQPYFIHPTDRQLFALAGLWDDTRPEDASENVSGSFTIITTSPNTLMAQLHNRMPVILDAGEESAWLSRDLTDPEAVIPLLDAYPADRMEAYPISTAVNDVRNNDPSLLERVESVREPAQRSLFS